jgi:hypothetical protein
MVSGQYEAGHCVDTGRDDRRPLAIRRVHNRDRILGPERRPDHIKEGTRDDKPIPR